MTDTQNYFELFQLPVAFRIDETLLESRYLSLQALLHPDRYVTAGEREKRLMAGKSVTVNDAYRVLSDACNRAAYLLHMEGLVLDSEKDTISDGDFLFQQMELEESLEAVADSGSATDAVQLLDDISQRLSAIQNRFDKAWHEHKPEDAREAALKMQFLAKVQVKAVKLVKRLGGKDEFTATG